MFLRRQRRYRCVMKVISWNLLHREGAELTEVARLIESQRPDLLMMQEVTTAFDVLPTLVGGVYSRTPLPGRVHGLAMWAPHAPARPPLIFPLPSGAIVHRVCQVVDLGPFSVANVHLSQGQLLNRRQLLAVVRRLPPCAAIIGDYNLVGPTLIPGFRDVGLRRHTHRMSDLVPLRLDRCLIRGLVCTEAEVLARGKSDHKPIMLDLALASEVGQQQARARIA
ncbi:endonuclease/exonuclease/phosphatase family protein [Acidisoma cladoniae]|uniref:endonuclease/exonuclease/phosphatase family protein n=1 Tax=Acidisoma cladoniae TaxID=3040935 RepID=UPI00254D4A72|nr:endonuclease/exonuclease/phosphatase family protein [Acidisoma sp. PAMC 29798]